MGFHKRYIDNEQVIRLYEGGGIARVREWYTHKVDALITETGLASKVGSVISDDDWVQFGTVKQDTEITKLIQQYLGVEDIRK
tara:strand:- start:409 stop:657 length:249 start_codon:yes stop_codon:yes gene_type:complete